MTWAIMRARNTQFVGITMVVACVIIYLYMRDNQKPKFKEMAMKQVQLSGSTVPHSCPLSYKNTYKKVSVIISTHLGKDSVISQTVNSIIAHTPEHMLSQIILLTSANIKEEHMSALQHEFTGYHPLVFIMKGDSDNLMKNRILSGHAAIGDVLLFMEDEDVVTERYLEPLLKALEEHGEGIVLPSFDRVSSSTIAIEKSEASFKYIFDWHFKVFPYEIPFQQLTQKTEVDLIPTPVFDGHAFLINKAYLEKLGTMKYQMNFEGSLDVSFAAWTCGDGIFIVPCSRIARTNIPRVVDEVKNKPMLAERYLTEKYMKVFRRLHKRIEPAKEDELRVEQNFQKRCPRTFDWYMENIVGEDVFVPTEETMAFGVFDSQKGTTCFRQDPSMIFIGKPCKMRARGELVEYTKSGLLRMGKNCIHPSAVKYMVTDPCNPDNPGFKWESTAYHQFKQGEFCLSHATDPYPEQKKRQLLMFAICNEKADLQWQDWESMTWLVD